MQRGWRQQQSSLSGLLCTASRNRRTPTVDGLIKCDLGRNTVMTTTAEPFQWREREGDFRSEGNKRNVCRQRKRIVQFYERFSFLFVIPTIICANGTFNTGGVKKHLFIVHFILLTTHICKGGVSQFCSLRSVRYFLWLCCKNIDVTLSKDRE